MDIDLLRAFISKTGYKADSEDKDRPMNIIPSGNITMDNVPHIVFGVDNLGNKKMMFPGNDYEFPGNIVTEIPIKQTGGETELDTTGYASRASDLMKKYNYLNWVQRAENNNNGLSPIGDKTHYTIYTSNDKGEYIVSPTVVQKEGDDHLTELLNRKDKLDYARKYGINVGQDRDFAEYFSQVGYKAKFPEDIYNEAKEDYSNFIKDRRLVNKYIIDDNSTKVDNTYVEMPKVPHITEKDIEETINKAISDNPDFDLEGLKRGLSQVESANGKLMMNKESTATGLYGQRFSELEDLNLYKGTREEFAKDIDAQNRIFNLRLNKGLGEERSMLRTADELRKEYSPQINMDEFSDEDLIALINFLGRQGLRNYLGYVLRDGRTLEDVFPDKYGNGSNQANKTPQQYLDIIRSFVKDKNKIDISKFVDHDEISPNFYGLDKKYKKGGLVYDTTEAIENFKNYYKIISYE